MSSSEAETARNTGCCSLLVADFDDKELPKSSSRSCMSAFNLSAFNLAWQAILDERESAIVLLMEHKAHMAELALVGIVASVAATG